MMVIILLLEQMMIKSISTVRIVYNAKLDNTMTLLMMFVRNVVLLLVDVEDVLFLLHVCIVFKVIT